MADEELREEMADLIRNEVARQNLSHYDPSASPAKARYRPPPPLDFRKIADAVVDGLDKLVADDSG